MEIEMESPSQSKAHDDQVELQSNKCQSSHHNSNDIDTDTSKSTRITTTHSKQFGDLPAQLSRYQQGTAGKINENVGGYFTQFYNKPVVTTLNSFSQVANLVRNPYELINNVDEFVKQHSVRHTHPTPNESGRQSVEPRDIDNSFSNLHSQDQELTLMNANHNQNQAHASDDANNPTDSNRIGNSSSGQILLRNTLDVLPPPALPRIECTNKQRRLSPLTLDEYIQKFQDQPDTVQLHEELIERIFRGSMDTNLLRQVLWPFILDISEYRDKIEKISEGEHKIIPDERNVEKWNELRDKFQVYLNQWKSILPEQESRFSAFRDRKSLIERDVIRCDRKHEFYQQDNGNLNTLSDLLMTYMMYDFDIGYVQGMSDLASPILYVYSGDIVKAFWTFVAVMKLFRRNFELSQKTIHFQLMCLYRLIKITDPCFGQYLREHDSSNCFFAFRCIVCQFKRELMKDDENDYTNVLYLWDTIWCVQSLTILDRQRRLQESCNLAAKMQEHLLENHAAKIPDSEKESDVISNLKSNIEEKSYETQGQDGDGDNIRMNIVDTDPKPSNLDNQNQDTVITKSNNKPMSDLKFQQCFYASFDPNQADIPRFELTDTEKFVLSLCLSLIRRERDTIMAHNLDSTEILQHFINPRLGDDLNNFIEHATNIYSYLKSDFDINRLLTDEDLALSSDSSGGGAILQADGGSNSLINDDGYDLLNDYLVIGNSGSI